MKPDTVVYENHHYVVKIGVSIHNTESELECYQIINREHDLIEAETTMLPSAIRTADELSGSLEEIYEDGEGDVDPTDTMENVTLQ